MPTVREVANCWAIGPRVKKPKDLPNNASADKKAKYEQDDAKCKAYLRKLDVLLWFVDCYLPMTVGTDNWGLNVRPYHLPTDSIQDENGKSRVHVPTAGQAFALVQFENSRQRWIEIFKWRDANPGKKNPPQYSKKKPDTHHFKALWSDYSHGQGSGWDPLAYASYNARVREIKAFREEEAAKGSPRMKFAKQLIRDFHEIPKDQTGPVTRAARQQVVVEEDDGDETEGEDLIFEDE